jgi:hypothetical protein
MCGRRVQTINNGHNNLHSILENDLFYGNKMDSSVRGIGQGTYGVK